MNIRLLLIYSLFITLLLGSCKADKTETANTQTTTDSLALEDSLPQIAVINTSAKAYAKPQVPVLCYHRIANGRKDDYSVRLTNFSHQIKTLADSGYHSISPAELYDYLAYNKALPEKPVMISFDDSRAEHAEIAAPVLEQYGFRGVFFIMTITYNKKNYMSKQQIADLAKAGHTIGLHSWDHTMATKYKDSTDWQTQIIDPKEKLAEITGQPVEYFAYPYGISNHEAAKQLSKYFKLSFILSTKRDSTQAFQTVRRIIATEGSASGLIRSMKKSFSRN